MRIEKAAGIIIFRRTEEGIKFLLLYHGGQYWNFPKGKIAEGEETIKTALREVREETGILERDLQLKGWFKVYDQFSFKRNKENVSKTVVFYLAETTKKLITISGREHQGYAWFAYRDAIRILTHENLKQNLKKAYDFIIGRRKTLETKPSSLRQNFTSQTKKETFRHGERPQQSPHSPRRSFFSKQNTFPQNKKISP